MKPDKPPAYKQKLKNRRHSAKTRIISKTKSDTSTQLQMFTKDEPNLKTPQKSEVVSYILTPQPIENRYPVLKDVELIEKFLAVPMSNNQKGRIRQLLKDTLFGTSDKMMPEVINKKIEAIQRNSEKLSDSELRKIRILHNMLKTSLKKLYVGRDTIAEEKQKLTKTLETKMKSKDNDKMAGDQIDPSVMILKQIKVLKEKNAKENLVSPVKEKKAKHTSASAMTHKNLKDDSTSQIEKRKKTKRYVVFMGNLPSDINKETIKMHFIEFADSIKSIRIPKMRDERNSAFAYVEFDNEPSYEFALSKHHTMLGNKRINVQYTTQKKSKLTKSEAKSKAAKLAALQRSGKLLGSVPLARKRSTRRKKMKAARQRNNTPNM